MSSWDTHIQKKGHGPITLVREIFDTSQDIMSWVQKEEEKVEKKYHWVKKIRAFFHFIFLTSIIFIVLLLISNWSAYSAFARSMIAPEALQREQEAIEGSIAQTDVTDSTKFEELKKARIQKILKRQLEKGQIKTQNLGASYFDQDVSRVSLSVNIAPYEDRIVIPKIGKNIPLVNVEHHNADNSHEWQRIFMKELEGGVVKYPGSADPGESGNSFIFGHSSNYPWAKGGYNDVFALLNELTAGDEIIVYFKQKKVVYTVKEKMVVKPGHVSSLGGDKNEKKLTLMTCWPLGTTLNRLLVVTELKNITSS